MRRRRPSATSPCATPTEINLPFIASDADGPRSISTTSSLARSSKSLVDDVVRGTLEERGAVRPGFAGSSPPTSTRSCSWVVRAGCPCSFRRRGLRVLRQAPAQGRESRRGGGAGRRDPGCGAHGSTTIRTCPAPGRHAPVPGHRNLRRTLCALDRAQHHGSGQQGPHLHHDPRQPDRESRSAFSRARATLRTRTISWASSCSRESDPLPRASRRSR